MWERCLFVMRRSMMTRFRLKGWLLDDTMSCASALQSSSSPLTFDPCVHLGIDPCVHLPIGLVSVGGAYRVPQVPVPQTCQSHTSETE